MADGRRGAALIILVGLALSACATARTTVAPEPPAPAVAAWPATTWDTTWYVTNRARVHGELVRVAADSLEYGFVVTRFREPERPGTTGHLEEGVDSEQVDSMRLTRDEFVSRLRALDSVAARQGTGSIMYVHGYAVSFSRAVAQGSEIAHRGQHAGPFVVFAWPAHGSVAAWPSTSAVFSRAYRDDSMAAAASTMAFRRAITDVQRAVRPQSLTIVGHSLGARLAAEALAADGPARDTLAASPLATLVLYAPDMSVTRLGDTLAPALAALAGRRVVYASDSDWLMRLSRLLNRSPRAGRASAARALAGAQVEVVDVTQGRRAPSLLVRYTEPGHAMRYAASALFDFYGVVRGVRSGCREVGGLAQRVADGMWRLTDAPLPAEPPGSTCR